MKFNIQEKKINVSEAVLDYTEKKISKLDRFFKAESHTQVQFSTLRGRYTAEVTLNNNGTFFRVTETTSDIYACIDSAVAAIERQIRKHKTKLEKRLRENAFEREIPPDAVSSDAEAEEPPATISRVKTFPIVSMTPDDAVTQMELLGHSFYMFRNSENEDKTCVVYRRRLGDFGMIEPME